jgi:hypothetical protein
MYVFTYKNLILRIFAKHAKIPRGKIPTVHFNYLVRVEVVVGATSWEVVWLGKLATIWKLHL